MFAPTPLLAEVADKEPTAGFFVFCCIVCVLAALPMLKSRWLALIAIPVALFWAALVWLFIQEELRDPFVGPAIVRELGQSYIVTIYASAVIPFVVIAALLFRRKKPNQLPEPMSGLAPGHGSS